MHKVSFLVFKCNIQINVNGNEVTGYLTGGVQYKISSTGSEMQHNIESRAMKCIKELLSVVCRV